ncbi:MAG TPA: hypothetical protein VFD36_20575 [Kofleriaceae bacterium]|nr:hypothetical protein [Kofleriaceae bacterium]
MTPTELLDLVESVEREQRKLGFEPVFVTLVCTGRRPRGETMYIFGRLRARVLGSKPRKDPGDKGGAIVSVKIEDVRAELADQAELLERNAIRLAELGKHEEADDWMKEYEALSSRLAGVVPRKKRKRIRKPRRPDDRDPDAPCSRPGGPP